jgi:hypothetical protein
VLALSFIQGVAARATLVALILAFGASDSLAAKKARKGCATARDCMSDEQKAKLRKQGRELCLKNHGNVHHVEIDSKGRATCWYVM